MSCVLSDCLLIEHRPNQPNMQNQTQIYRSIKTIPLLDAFRSQLFSSIILNSKIHYFGVRLEIEKILAILCIALWETPWQSFSLSVPIPSLKINAMRFNHVKQSIKIYSGGTPPDQEETSYPSWLRL